MSNGEWNVDDDGFLVGDKSLTKAPPHVIEVPKFFDDCVNRDEAIRKMISELGKPFSIEMDGHDIAYKRLFDAQILILSILGDYIP